MKKISAAYLRALDWACKQDSPELGFLLIIGPIAITVVLISLFVSSCG